jgi:hypothetical protein
MGSQPLATSGDLPGLIKSFERHLRAANRSPRTVEKYTLAARQLVTFMADQDGPLNAVDVKRRDVEGYISFLLDRYKPGTALTRYQLGFERSAPGRPDPDEPDVEHGHLEGERVHLYGGDVP